MRKEPLYRVLAALVVLSVIWSAAAHEGATGVVKERVDAMEVMAKALKAINRRITQKRDLELVKTDAGSIQEAAAKMPSLFPPRTDQHPSAARTQVWQNWPDFESKARALVAETSKLAEIDNRDLKALRTQALRVADTCSNCHELYRAKHQH